MNELTGAAAHGATTLMDLAPIITVLILAIFVLLWFIHYLLKEAKEERKLNREALIGNTVIMTRLEELIRHTVQK